MQGLVTVLLRGRDIVIELIGDHAPEVMHNAKRGVAVANFRHQNAYGTYIEYLREIEFLRLHLAPDAVDVLCAPCHFRIDIGPVQLPAQLFGHFHDESFAIHATLIQQAGNTLVIVFLQVSE